MLHLIHPFIAEVSSLLYLFLREISVPEDLTTYKRHQSKYFLDWTSLEEEVLRCMPRCTCCQFCGWPSNVGAIFTRFFFLLRRRAVFSWVLNSYWFCIATLHVIGLKNSRQFIIQSEVKPKKFAIPALPVSCMYLLWVLIGSLYCLCPVCVWLEWLPRFGFMTLNWKPLSSRKAPWPNG